MSFNILLDFNPWPKKNKETRKKTTNAKICINVRIYQSIMFVQEIKRRQLCYAAFQMEKLFFVSVHKTAFCLDISK